MNQYSIVHIINKAHLNLFVIFNCSQYKKSSFKACCKSPLTSEHVWIRTESHEYKKNTMSEILLQFYLFSFVYIKKMSNLHRSGYVEKIEIFLKQFGQKNFNLFGTTSRYWEYTNVMILTKKWKFAYQYVCSIDNT